MQRGVGEWRGGGGEGGDKEMILKAVDGRVKTRE